MPKKSKILIIDDDRDFLDATSMVLESSSYQVITSADGDDGLRKAKQERPDLVLLDVIMPIKDGFSVAEVMKKDPQLAKIPVLMLTSFAQRKGETSLSVSQGMKLEAEDYLDKPVAPDELLRRVKKWLKATR